MIRRPVSIKNGLTKNANTLDQQKLNVLGFEKRIYTVKNKMVTKTTFMLNIYSKLKNYKITCVILLL